MNLLSPIWKSIPVSGQLKKLRKPAAYTWQTEISNIVSQWVQARCLRQLWLCAVPSRLPTPPAPATAGVQHQGTSQHSRKHTPYPWWCHHTLCVPLLLPLQSQHEAVRRATSICGGWRQDCFTSFSSNGLNQTPNQLGNYDIKDVPL